MDDIRRRGRLIAEDIAVRPDLAGTLPDYRLILLAVRHFSVVVVVDGADLGPEILIRPALALEDNLVDLFYLAINLGLVAPFEYLTGVLLSLLGDFEIVGNFTALVLLRGAASAIAHILDVIIGRSK